MNLTDIIIVGSGPAGLATAIAAKQVGLTYRVFEKGVLVNSILNFPSNMIFFTTPELLEIGGLPFITPYEKPTRVEALRYYRRVVETYKIPIELDREVIAIEREQSDMQIEPFVVSTQSQNGSSEVSQARTVVMATGCYDHPNLINVPGEELPHVSHYYSEPYAYYRKHVVIVGGKNSAAEVALDLYRAGAQVTLIHRGDQLADGIKYWVKPDIQNRIDEKSVSARFNSRVVEIRSTEVVVEYNGSRDVIPTDAVFLLTGYHADRTLFEQAGVQVGSSTSSPEHNSETFETNVSGLYAIGAAISGSYNGQIFIENGRFHGEVVVDQIRRRLEDQGVREK